MATVLKADSRNVRRAKPTGELFDAKQALDYTQIRYPNLMARLAE